MQRVDKREASLFMGWGTNCAYMYTTFSVCGRYRLERRYCRYHIRYRQDRSFMMSSRYRRYCIRFRQDRFISWCLLQWLWHRRYSIRYRQDCSLVMSGSAVAAVPHMVPSVPHTVTSGPFPFMMPCIVGAVPSLPSVPHTVPSGPFSDDVFYSGCGTVGTELLRQSCILGKLGKSHNLRPGGRRFLGGPGFFSPSDRGGA